MKPDYSDVIHALKTLSVLHAPADKPFVLKSGVLSSHYVDVRLASLNPWGLRNLVDGLCRAIVRMPDHVAGVVLGGCPLATGVSLRKAISALYVRSEAKGHGTCKLIEGPFTAGDSVVVLEDVITTGGSTLKALAALRDAGLKPIHVIAVLDREEGGIERVNEVCPCTALVTLKELLT